MRLHGFERVLVRAYDDCVALLFVAHTRSLPLTSDENHGLEPAAAALMVPSSYVMLM
jgi:hypothetical protein